MIFKKCWERVGDIYFDVKSTPLQIKIVKHEFCIFKCLNECPVPCMRLWQVNSNLKPFIFQILIKITILEVLAVKLFLMLMAHFIFWFLRKVHTILKYF